MATTAAPYGLKPVKRADGMPYAGATSQYLIDPAGEATNLFYGQVVQLFKTHLAYGRQTEKNCKIKQSKLPCKLRV